MSTRPSIGDKKSDEVKLFESFSLGIATGRDAWCYNSSRSLLEKNMEGMISFYNSEVVRFSNSHGSKDKKTREELVDNFIETDRKKISWERGIKNELAKLREIEFSSKSIVCSLYRPYTKQWLYFNRKMNAMVYQMPRIFPNGSVKNRVISLVGIGTPKGFSVTMADVVPDLQLQANGQCFPLKIYERAEVPDIDASKPGLFDDQPIKSVNEYEVRDGITDAGLKHFQDAYQNEQISKEDIFYYVYGLLHSEDYKSRYADNLTKELPRIPRVAKAADFWAFSKAGRTLADLHTGYEEVTPFPVHIEGGALLLTSFTPQDFRVEQMKFAKGKSGEKHDKTRVIYNHKITMSGIPLEAYNYVVNGKPALEWVMERQAVSEHKDSGIVNDANLWAIETMNDASYPLKLFQRVITVSLETMKIVRSLPRL